MPPEFVLSNRSSRTHNLTYRQATHSPSRFLEQQESGTLPSETVHAPPMDAFKTSATKAISHLPTTPQTIIEH